VRVLIVEDEMTIAFLIEDMLTDLGHEVVEIAMRLPVALVCFVATAALMPATTVSISARV